MLGPYRLEAILGRGGMGVVYEAYDPRLDRRVAVKRLLPGHDDPRRRSRLLREARTTAGLDHPAIVQVFDLIEDNAGGDWIVMERIDGTPLANLLREGPLDVEIVLRYGRQIAQGLVAAHALDIVHRDLKTENVMVLHDGRVKILDFGIAKQMGSTSGGSHEQDLSKTGAIIGTGRAMAPEQARGLTVGPRSDLFSFGVLLYECLTSVSPFRGTSPTDTLARIVSHQPQPVEDLVPAIPEGLAELIARLLRKAPELRPASAAEVEQRLDALIEERPAGSSDPIPSNLDDQRTVTTSGASSQLATDDTGRSSQSAVGISGLATSKASRRVLIGVGVLLGALIVVVTSLRSFLDAEPVEGVVALQSVTTPSDPYETAIRQLRYLDEPDTPARVIAVFREVIEREPESATAYVALARAYWEKARNASAGGDPVFLDQALAMAQEGVRLNGYLADGRAVLGLVLSALGRYDEAAEHLRVALELDPTHADGYYGLAKLADAVGRLDEAEDHLRRAAKLHPAPLYCNALGALLYDLGRYDEAERAFLATLALAPDDLHALRNLGAIYHAQGRLEEAATKLQDALKIRPDASLFSNLGTVLFGRGLYSQAAAAFEDALAMDGASNRYIFWLNLADTYRQLPERSADAERVYRRAIQMLDDLLEARPRDIRLRSRRALALARSGDLDTASADVEVLRRAGTGGDLYSLFRLAVVEELVGRRERAVGTLSEALRSGFSLAEVRLEPDLVDLRTDPRFHHLLAEIERGQ